MPPGAGPQAGSGGAKAPDRPSRNVTHSGATYVPGPGKRLKYVEACAAGDWHLDWTRYDGATGEVLQTGKAPYRCRSWRHPGPCRRWRAAQNFSRTNQALLTCRPRDVVFAVFTLRPSDWSSRYEAFRELRERWKALRKAITRTFGPNRYVSTVEVHRSGWPHLNVVIDCPPLSDAVGNRNSGVVAWLKRHALACGFGYMLSAERAKSRAALAGYVVKLAGDVESGGRRDEHGQLSGEVHKLSQVPERAPRHFRRLRASIRFLAKPYKRENMTGELLRSPLPARCEVTGGALQPPASGVAVPAVATAAAKGLPRVRAQERHGAPATGPPQLRLALTGPPTAPGSALCAPS